MKITRLAALLALGLGLEVGGTVHAQTHYVSQPRGNEVKIEGTSTLHDWEMKGGIIGGYIEFGSGIKFDPSATQLAGVIDGKVPIKAHAFIPVRSVHSEADHLPDVMDHLMQDTLKADQFGKIDYYLTGMTFTGPHAAGQPYQLNTTGELAIAGVTNKVSFPVTITSMADDKIKVSGTVPLKMTAFGVTPPAPSFGLGVMKCGDEVKIIFDWVLAERK